MTDDKNRQLLMSLVYSFQMQTMMQLGKLANPMTNTIEKHLDGAQVTIDMLDMLKAKTKGNLGEDEIRFLDQVIADLKLNYVEERDKDNASEIAEDIAVPDAEVKTDDITAENLIAEAESKSDSKSQEGAKADTEGTKADTSGKTVEKTEDESDKSARSKQADKPEADSKSKAKASDKTKAGAEGKSKK